jgi:outer membrane protein assembly factor BamB
VRLKPIGIVVLVCLVTAPLARADDGWRQWGGPNRNFVVDATGLASQWPDGGPPVRWSRPLGTGHSAIVAADGRLFTMYRAGNGRGRRGPWDAEEAVIALDAATGKTLWEYRYPSKREDFGFGAGPHSTPIIVGKRLFAFGTNKQLHALDASTGKVLWSHDLVKEFGAPELLIRPVVKAGYGCSPIAFRDTIICSVGGPGQSVMAFRQSDGAVVWKSGDFLTSEVAPIVIDVAGRPQLVVVGGGTVNGLDPANGTVLWSHPHDPGNDLNCATPIWGKDGVLFISSAYKAGSRALRLVHRDGATMAEEMWFTSRLRFMFLSAVRVGDHVYGTTGDFGPAFLTALDLKTGEAMWQQRGFSRASLVYADGKAIILEEDGDLTLATLSPDGAAIASQARIFDTPSWTAPTLVGTTLFARDREKIVALDLGFKQTEAGEIREGNQSNHRETGEIREDARSRASAAASTRRHFAGTWALDARRSRLNETATLAGLIGAGAPPILHITQPANGTLVVESQINESHARIYRPGDASTTAVTVGSPGTVSVRSRWDGSTLVSEGTRETTVGGSQVVDAVREAFSMNPDGTLAIEVTTTIGGEKHVSTSVYRRAASVGPCQSWPTPCKSSS